MGDRPLQARTALVQLHFRCWKRCLFISNMVTRSFPNTAFSLPSATISRLFSGFWRLCFLMYSQTLLTASGRDRGLEPTTAASSLDGCMGFMRAGLALRPDALSFDPLLPALFAILCSRTV